MITVVTERWYSLASHSAVLVNHLFYSNHNLRITCFVVLIRSILFHHLCPHSWHLEIIWTPSVWVTNPMAKKNLRYWVSINCNCMHQIIAVNLIKKWKKRWDYSLWCWWWWHWIIDGNDGDDEDDEVDWEKKIVTHFHWLWRHSIGFGFSFTTSIVDHAIMNQRFDGVNGWSLWW